MAKYEINIKGYHDVIESEVVELTDQEVQSLVDLINETGTTDVKTMKLEDRIPDVYEKLYDTCSTIAFHIELAEALRDGLFNDPPYECIERMEYYCTMYLGYNDKSEEDEEYEEEEREDIRRWFQHYASDKNYRQLLEIFDDAKIGIWEYDELTLGFNPDGFDYSVEVVLPSAIIERI